MANRFGLSESELSVLRELAAGGSPRPLGPDAEHLIQLGLVGRASTVSTGLDLIRGDGPRLVLELTSEGRIAAGAQVEDGTATAQTGEPTVAQTGGFEPPPRPESQNERSGERHSHDVASVAAISVEHTADVATMAAVSVENSGNITLSPGPAEIRVVPGTPDVVVSKTDRWLQLSDIIAENIPKLRALGGDLTAAGSTDLRTKSDGQLIELVVTPSCIRFTVEISELPSQVAKRSLARMLLEVVVGAKAMALDPRTLALIGVIEGALDLVLRH